VDVVVDLVVVVVVDADARGPMRRIT